MRVMFLLTLFVLLGCGSQEATRTQPAQPPSISEAMCLLAVDYDGHQYIGASVLAPPEYGKSLGQAKVPACNDTPGAVDDTPEQLVEVFALKRVTPETAIAMRDQPDTVLIRDDVDQENLPPALAKLMPPR
jgi:hypothetical protein